MAEELTCEAVADRGWVESYLAGSLSEAEVEEFESHFLTCSHCQNELRLGVAIQVTLPEVQKRAETFDGRTRALTAHWFRRPAGVGTAAAAVAAILIGVLLVRSPYGEPSPHRDTVPETPALPGVDSPNGEVPAVEEFRWTPVPTADLYRVTLFDAAGEVIWQVDTRETHIAPADTVPLIRGALYLWQVDARVGWDRWVSSELVRFRVSGP
jgi:hypothetical protein